MRRPYILCDRGCGFFHLVVHGQGGDSYRCEGSPEPIALLKGYIPHYIDDNGQPPLASIKRTPRHHRDGRDTRQLRF